MLSKDKRGQGLSINAIILIVLGVIVLVVLIAGFAFGWGNLRDSLFSSNNVDKVVTACETACSLDNKYDYCTQERELKASDLPEKKATGTCDMFSTDAAYDKYGIKDCSGLCEAKVNCNDYKVGDKQASEKASCDVSIETEVSLGSVIVTQGMKCCIDK
ncbi:MAG: hypothetical protein AABY22_30725 [Nanoarchaeota archaeon]